MTIRTTAGALAWVLVLLPTAAASDWPQFRGPDGQGHSTSKNVPLTWSETENIAWKTAVPGHGWSSPSILGQQIWVTTATDENHSLRAICVDRTTGKVTHDVEVFHIDEPGAVHANNSHASPTPVLEPGRVYVHFGAHGTAALSAEGKILWKNNELKYNHGHGPGASPVVWNDLLLISCDGTDVQYVVALDKNSGVMRWKRERAHISAERKSGASQVPMAYCTPLVLKLGGVPQLVALGSDSVVSYVPDTGEEIWWFRFNGYSNVSRPVYGNGLLYFSSGFGAPELYAVKVPGRGDLTESNKVWNATKGAVVPLDVSPLLVGQELYTISDAGIAVCYDAATGKTHWTQRLGGKFWASPVLADGKIYCLDDSAVTYVLRPGTAYEELAVNKLEGESQASPAIVDGAIFLRTGTHLYRIENATKSAAK
ncbi:MAG: PQQ-binding-like beta-propeller repeat protein [Pirellulales bacterium]